MSVVLDRLPVPPGMPAERPLWRLRRAGRTAAAFERVYSDRGNSACISAPRCRFIVPAAARRRPVGRRRTSCPSSSGRDGRLTRFPGRFSPSCSPRCEWHAGTSTRMAFTCRFQSRHLGRLPSSSCELRFSGFAFRRRPAHSRRRTAGWSTETGAGIPSPRPGSRAGGLRRPPRRRAGLLRREFREGLPARQSVFTALQSDGLARELDLHPGRHDFDIWNIVEHQVNVINQLKQGELPRAFKRSVPGVIDDRRSDGADGLVCRASRPSRSGTTTGPSTETCSSTTSPG